MNLLNLTHASVARWTCARRRAPTLRRGLHVGACLVALAMALATVGGAVAQEAEESAAITDLFTSLLTGVGKQSAKQGEKAAVSWAMSAIGLSGGDGGQLGAISEELQQIDADLEAIDNTLNEILAGTEAQTCTETQIAPSLQDAVNNITNLYNKYASFIDNAARGIPPSQEEDVLPWQSAVLNSISGVAADLNAIHNGVYTTVNANVINKCAIATATPYVGAEKDIDTFFDDRPSYSQLVNIVNYYYGVATQGATILAEAYHLQACQAAAKNDPNLHCDFTTASNSTSASDVSTICDAPTDLDVQRACLEAQEAVTDPDTGTGLYERVQAWLKAAGAPYATGEAVSDSARTFVSGELGLLSSIDSSNTSSWSSSYAYIFPKGLLDFTNHATINGVPQSDCASPLTSTHPCGLTVGRYDLTLSSELSYGGINGHWKPSSAEVLLLLLEPYNRKTFGTTSGTLGDFMHSIGFSSALQSGGLIILTGNTGKNKDTGTEAICFMDTSVSRDQSEQPWCDDIPGEVQGTDQLIHNKLPNTEEEWTHNLASNPKFYIAGYFKQTKGGSWGIAPGWSVQGQDSTAASDIAIFYQYHWPMTNVSEIGCQNGKPYLNPGGLLSRCAGDLQEYVDALLPPPESDTTALDASGDATLLEDQPNRNMGEDPRLAVGSGGSKNGAMEVVVHFADKRLERFLTDRELASAILRLSLADRGSPRKLEIVPLPDGFAEGKGSVGTGATWACAKDADVSNDSEECLQQWPDSRFADGVTRRPDQRDEAKGLIGFDVTQDVAAGVSAWMIRSPIPGASDGAYYSREGATAAREPWRAPTLLLERRPADAARRLPASAGR